MIPNELAATGKVAPTKPTRRARKPLASAKAQEACAASGLSVIKLSRIDAMMEVGDYMHGENALSLGRGVLAFSMSAATAALEGLQDMLDDPIVQASPELRVEVLKATVSASAALGKQGEAIVESTKVAPPEVPASPVRAAFGPGTPLDKQSVTINNSPGGTVQVATLSPQSGQGS